MLRLKIYISSLLLMLALFGAGMAEEAKWSQVRPELVAANVIHNPAGLKLSKNGPVIVTFFASWCPPCTLEFRHLNQIHRQVSSSGATIIGVNLHEDFGGKKNPQRMERFLKKTKPKFALYKGNAAIASKFGGVPRIPTVVLFDHQGNETWRFVHERDAEKTHATATDILNALKRINGS